jgi:hypothetical protein
MRRVIAACFLVLIASAAQADSCDDATAAYIGGDYPNALKLLVPLAERGEACAELRLGYMYQGGQGVEKDPEKALDFFKQAAAQGNNEAKAQAAMLEKSAGG